MGRKSCFKILYKDKSTQGRIGIITTKSGKIETPFFMPVATKASVKYISSSDLKEMDARAVISNSLILHLRPGEEFIKSLGGVKKFMSFEGTNVTDSGGFQMYSPALYVRSNEQGVEFRNPFESKKVFITPEKSMKIQLDIGADIAMCLDTMPLLNQSKEEINLAVERTTNWARRCKDEHEKLQKDVPLKKRQLLWGITQGGVHNDLRKKSAEGLKKIDFEGYSCGGLALGETLEEEMKMLKVHKKIIGTEKPCYLMGAGNPPEIIEAISLGADMFDSRFPTKCARHGTIFTSEGRLRLMQNKYELDKSPLDKECKCYVCKKYSRSYIRYQLKQREAVGYHLASYHNLFYLQTLIKKAKKAIKKGELKKLVQEIKRAYKN